MSDQKSPFTEEQITKVIVDRNVSREAAINILESEAWHAANGGGREKKTLAAAKPAPAQK